LTKVSNTSSRLPSSSWSFGSAFMALRSTGKCATVPAMPTQLGPVGVSTLNSLLLASWRCDRRVSPKVTSVSAAIAT
jgi:hypothetical protein